MNLQEICFAQKHYVPYLKVSTDVKITTFLKRKINGLDTFTSKSNEGGVFVYCKSDCTCSARNYLLNCVPTLYGRKL